MSLKKVFVDKEFILLSIITFLVLYSPEVANLEMFSSVIPIQLLAVVGLTLSFPSQIADILVDTLFYNGGFYSSDYFTGTPLFPWIRILLTFIYAYGLFVLIKYLRKLKKSKLTK